MSLTDREIAAWRRSERWDELIAEGLAAWMTMIERTWHAVGVLASNRSLVDLGVRGTVS